MREECSRQLIVCTICFCSDSVVCLRLFCVIVVVAVIDAVIVSDTNLVGMIDVCCC